MCKKLKQQINDLKRDLILGKVREVSFIGGPKDGDGVFIKYENGHPKSLKRFFIVPNIFKFSEPVEKAEYEWCFKDEVFIFTGQTKQEKIERQFPVKTRVDLISVAVRTKKLAQKVRKEAQYLLSKSI